MVFYDRESKDPPAFVYIVFHRMIRSYASGWMVESIFLIFLKQVIFELGTNGTIRYLNSILNELMYQQDNMLFHCPLV